MDEVIVKLYVETLLITVMVAIYLISALKKKRWICWEKMAPDIKQMVKRNEKRINIVLKCTIGLFLGIIFMWHVIPAIKDFPNVMQEEYLEAEGEVIEWDYGRETRRRSRSIAIIDSKTNRKVNVVVYSTGIYEGERLKVTYLPNSKFGIVEERK